MTIENIKDIHDLELITAITIQYQADIEEFLLLKRDEVLQEDFAKVVYDIYTAYMNLNINRSLLDLINHKHLSIL
ncbi:hypothetical protein ACFYSI_13515 [Staphylococcus xylosus]|uniref:hypothetical protein n=1 Tax=Staphylococcus xylosus TaxID=1288 RepID=UPI0036C68242